MKDSNGQELHINQIVTVSNTFSKTHSGNYVVDRVSEDSAYLKPLNKDLSLSKSKESISWPIRMCCNDRCKRREGNLHNKQFAQIVGMGDWTEPAPKPKKMGIKFLQNGIRRDDEYIPVYYSLDMRTQIITIYARSYCKHLPREIGNVRNESDSMTDYFETDSCRLSPSDPFYKQALEVCKKRADKKSS